MCTAQSFEIRLERPELVGLLCTCSRPVASVTSADRSADRGSADRGPARAPGRGPSSASHETENPVFEVERDTCMFDADPHCTSTAHPLSSTSIEHIDSIDVDDSGCISMEGFVEWWDVHASGSDEDDTQLDAAIDI